MFRVQRVVYCTRSGTKKYFRVQKHTFCTPIRLSRRGHKAESQNLSKSENLNKVPKALSLPRNTEPHGEAHNLQGGQIAITG